MVKFSHSVFALPFAILATFMAARELPGGMPGWGRLALIVWCMVAARSFAMTVNRVADAAIDARNPRTAGRHLPDGRIERREALAFMAAAAALFIAGCAGFHWFFDNRWPIALCLPTLAVLAAYSYAKRFTALTHFVLGWAIALSPVAAWIAIHPTSIGAPALLLCGAVTFWIAGFDIIYACQDVEVDRAQGLYSLPARMGVPAALLISRTAHAATVLCLAGVGVTAEMGILYWAGLIVSAVLLAAEQSLVRAGDLSRVNVAFFTFNGCIGVLLGTAGVMDILVT